MTDKAGPAGARASRRRFFKLLAGSPLAALAYPAIAASRQSDTRPFGVSPRTAGPRCPDCGGSMVFASPSEISRYQAQGSGTPAQGTTILDAQLSGQLVESVDEAINVWDFEKVAHTNTLPQHWAYIHMGVDDFETRSANREGFQRLSCDRGGSGLDSGEAGHVGQAVRPPMGHAAVPLSGRGARGLSHRGRERRGSGRATRGGILQIQSHQSSQSYEPIAEARGEPQWFQLYANARLGHHEEALDRVSRSGMPRAGVDRRPAGRQQP